MPIVVTLKDVFVQCGYAVDDTCPVMLQVFLNMHSADSEALLSLGSVRVMPAAEHWYPWVISMEAEQALNLQFPDFARNFRVRAHIPGILLPDDYQQQRLAYASRPDTMAVAIDRKQHDRARDRNRHDHARDRSRSPAHPGSPDHLVIDLNPSPSAAVPRASELASYLI